MTLNARQRLALPLKGNTPIVGNIRIVLEKNHAEVHYTADLKSAPKRNMEVLALDLGYTEAFTDSEGHQYGTALGPLMSKFSDTLKRKDARSSQITCFTKKVLRL